MTLAMLLKKTIVGKGRGLEAKQLIDKTQSYGLRFLLLTVFSLPIPKIQGSGYSF